MNRIFEDKEVYYEGEDLDRWLDSMSYKDLLEKIMGCSPRVTEFLDPVLAVSMGGVGADVYSAYSAKLLDMPGTSASYQYDANTASSYSFPGGNSGLFRHIVKYLVPASIKGGNSFGHSELSGYMSHTSALIEGARAARVAMRQL